MYFLSSYSLAMAEEYDANFGEMFRKVLPKLEEIRDCYNQQSSLPDSTFIGKDKKSNQEKIDALISQSIDILDISNVKFYKKGIEEREKKIQTSQENISNYKRERLSSPKGTDSIFDNIPFTQTTQEWYDKKIAAEEENIKKYRTEIGDRILSLKKEMEQIDIRISEDESDQLLHTVEVENFIKMHVAFSNIKKIRAQLERLTSENGEDLKTAKRYYGMHTILVRIVDRIQKKYLSTIETVYLPKLNEYEDKTNDIISKSNKNLDRIAREEHKKMLLANIAALELNMKAINIYRAHLYSQKNKILSDNKKVIEDMRIAEITYSTVSLSKDIFMMIKSSTKIFDIVSSMEVPPISEFKNQEIKEELVKLTQRMQQVAQH